LKAEGISNEKDFARKYHPDLNKNAPQEIKNNFSQIHSALKSGDAFKEPLAYDKLYKNIHEEDQAAIKGVNKKIWERFGV
jgi:DnaJ-class molecular chaperone